MQVDVGKQRRCRCPLRGSLHALRPFPVLDDSCAEPFLDQTQDPSVRDAVLKELQKPRPVEAGEVVADVRVEHPVHAPSEDRDRERIQRVMRFAPGAKPVGEASEVRLVDAVEHLDDGALEDLVLQRGDTERPQPPVPFGDVRPPNRLRAIAPAMDPFVQTPEIVLQVLPVGPPRHAVHPRRRLRAQCPIGRPEAIDLNVMQEHRELRFLVCLCDTAHAVQLTWRALPGSVSGTRFAGRVPLGQPPFLHHLRHRWRGVVRRLRRYYGAV